jgi:hypothetical protein
MYIELATDLSSQQAGDSMNKVKLLRIITLASVSASYLAACARSQHWQLSLTSAVLLSSQIDFTLSLSQTEETQRRSFWCLLTTYYWLGS